MPRTLPIDAFWQRLREGGLPVVDVRSPSEYAQGHLEGAVSLPLFDDDERARVGTTYKQQGRQAAVLLGLELVGRKLSVLAQAGLALAPQGRIGVHCWRGGMRSSAVAWLFEQAGLEAFVLQNGYKAWRQFALQAFEQPRQVVVVGGLTGSAKTDALAALSTRGEQVICLETLAHHRGSAFGAIGLEPPPTQEQFENALAAAWLEADPTRPLWLEDESRHLGRLHLPAPVWEQLRAAPVLLLEVPRAERVRYLIEHYGSFPAEALADSIGKITKRLGGLATQQALDALAAGDLAQVCERMLDYYDRTYTHGLEQRPPERVWRIPATRAEGSQLADLLLSHRAAVAAAR